MTIWHNSLGTFDGGITDSRVKLDGTFQSVQSMRYLMMTLLPSVLTLVCSRLQKASEAARVFYGRAKRALIMQCAAICFSVVVYLVATWVIHQTEFGMYTAIIPLVVRVSDNIRLVP